MRVNYVMQCYNCGKPLTRKTNNGEHIPPKNLFEGRGPEYKVNRKKIPACYECNHNYSLTDEEFRNLIGIINKQPDLLTLTEKTFRSMTLGEERKKRIMYDKSGKPIAVSFDFKDIKRFHIKNFKGVFYIQYGYALPNNYRIIADVKEGNVTQIHLDLISYLKDNFEWKYSGHPDIFSYIIQPFRKGYKFDGKDIKPESNEGFFVCLLRYNITHSALVIADLRS